MEWIQIHFRKKKCKHECSIFAALLLSLVKDAQLVIFLKEKPKNRVEVINLVCGCVKQKWKLQVPNPALKII